MANAKISNDSIFDPKTNVRDIEGFAGYDSSGNAKISGPALVTSVINSNGSGAEGRIPFYGAGADNLGGSSGFTWNQSSDTLAIGTAGGAAGLNADLVLNGNYIAGNGQPELTFKFGDTTNTPSIFKITTQSTGSDQTWLLPTSLPTAGQILSAEPNGSEVTLDWVDDNANTPNNNTITLAAGTGLTGGGDFTLNQNSNETITFNASGGGGIDFSGLNITTIKADLTQSSQTQYGQTVTVKASADIDNGGVVVWDYSGTEVQAQMPSGATPDQHEIIGIAIEDITAGNTGEVLVYGYATAKFVPIAGNVVSNLALTTGVVNGGTTIVSDINNATTFTDANVGPNNSYASNSVLSHTFYNNEGTISMKFVNWNIEQSAGNIYDRLGFTVSNDGSNFANATFTPATDSETGGFRQSSTPVAPWGSGEDTGNADGYILCESPGGAFLANSTINTGFKYVRAYFSSDSVTEPSPGWEIEVYGSSGIGSSSVAINEGVFINPNDLSATTGLANTGRTLGNYISTDVTNNAVVMFVAPARPQQ